MRIIMCEILCIVMLLSGIEACAKDIQPMQKDKIEFEYESISGSLRVSIRQDGSLMIGDYGIIAKICKPSSGYFCVNSDLFHFAVPRKLGSENKTWTVDKRTYELIQKPESQSIFGVRYSVAVISSMITTPAGSKVTTFFYYSPKKGLLAFEDRRDVKPGDTAVLPPGKAPSLMMLAGTHGFGGTESE